FYVAITRAKHRAYLVADMTVASRFVVELLNEKYPVELNEFDVSLLQRIFEKIRCRRCHTGIMQLRSGPFGDFFGCSHYPRCKHTEQGCADCGLPMHKVGQHYLCVDEKCAAWNPVCPQCGAMMYKRRGRYGDFWGCSNYHPQQENSCVNTCQLTAVPVPERGDNRLINSGC
ncbi:MAG: topoisomerase DNA-binding C4 zinc finger domain-containing protein, partial [Deltaproteobacteria bacterium]|nr:topoisomerase DNA-binding C4 zinc finger domain-containing protein [Deltaproteobacteria bacterium]